MNKKYASILGGVGLLALVTAGVIHSSNQKRVDPADPQREALVPLAAQHDAQDVAFLTQLIQQHGLTLAMVTQIEQATENDEVKRAARNLRIDQTAEVERMQQWLSQWGEPVTAAEPTTAAATAKLTELSKATGAELDQMFLAMVIERHQTEIELATVEQKRGRYAPARDLANAIISDDRARMLVFGELITRG